MAEGGGGGGSGSALRELLVAFGIDIETEGLKSLGEKIGETKDRLKEMAEILGAGFLGEKVKEFVQGQIEAGAQLKRTASMLGTSTDELQALQLAAGSAGVPVEDMTNSLRFLNRNMAEAAEKGGDTAAIFQKFGIHIKDASGEMRPAGDVMQDLADHMSGMSDPAEKTAAAMKLLGRGGAALIPLLNKGGAAFAEARESMEALGGGISEEFTEKAEEAEAAQYKLTFALTGFKSLVAKEFLPTVVAIAEKMTGWVAGAIKLAKETTVLKSAFVALNIGGAVLMFMKLYKVLGLAQMGITGAVRALAGFAWPILLVGGLYLIFDDLFALMTGGKSLIGDLLDKYEGVGTAQKLAEGLRDVWTELNDLWTATGPILKSVLAEGLKDAYKFAKGIVGILAGGANYAVAAGYAVASNDKESARHSKAADRGIGDSIDTIASAFQSDDDAPAPEPTGKTRQPISMQRGEPAPTMRKKPDAYFAPAPMLRTAMTQSVAAPASPTIVQQTVKADVRVQTGSGDPKAIGRAVADGTADGLQRHMQDAASAFGAGG